MGGCSGWDLLAMLHSDGRKVDTELLRGTQRYSVEGEATGRAAKWAKDGEIRSGSLL